MGELLPVTAEQAPALRKGDHAAPPLKGAHLPALDSIRGIAILMVMFYHFGHGARDTTAFGTFVFKLMRLGGSGVDLFFVLSGFLITGILFDARPTPHFFRNFYMRRTLRIFPLYYGVLAVCLVLLPALGVAVDLEARHHQAWLWLYGTNLLQAWKDSYLLGGFNHFWSLAVEEHFYLFWPLIIYVCPRRTGMWVCAGCVLGALACRLALTATGDHAIAAYVLTPCRMDALAAGAFLALAARGPRGPAGLLPLAVVSILAAGPLLVYLFFQKIDLARMDGTVLVWRSALSAWLFAAILVLAINTSPGTVAGRCWNWSVLRFFGKYSYGLYVFHPLLLLLLTTWIAPDALASPLGSVLAGRLVYAALGIGVSVLAALLSWHLYEKHFLKFKNFFAPRLAAKGSERGARPC